VAIRLAARPFQRQAEGMKKKLKVKVKDRWYTVEVEDLHTSPVRAFVDGELVEVSLDDSGNPTALAPVAPRAESRPVTPTPVSSDGARQPARSAAPAGGGKSFRSPMPGVIVSVAVKVGDQVVTGDEVCILEAMKMQQVLRADWSGVVKTVHVTAGKQVMDGDAIVDLE